MYIQANEGLGQAAPASCNPAPGEVALSHTASGILGKDVEVTAKGVLVADFGVDRRSVKTAAKTELAPLLRRFETDPAITEIRIHGFTDCIGPGNAAYQTWLRRERARRIRDLLGPVARSKLKFFGPAPVNTFIGPNTDRVGRARNRSVLIEFQSKIDFPPEAVEVKPCPEQLMRRALLQIGTNPNLDAKISSRLRAALSNASAGGDDSFIRPGSTSAMFAFRWSGIAEYFRELCQQASGSSALSTAGLNRKLLELDQDIVNGLDAFARARRQFSSILNKKAALEANFGQRLTALFKNKAKTVYAEY
jgi:outer membrane protein OmpA-like peptidoglycan-associated protein